MFFPENLHVLICLKFDSSNDFEGFCIKDHIATEVAEERRHPHRVPLLKLPPMWWRREGSARQCSRHCAADWPDWLPCIKWLNRSVDACDFARCARYSDSIYLYKTGNKWNEAKEEKPCLCLSKASTQTDSSNDSSKFGSLMHLRLVLSVPSLVGVLPAGLFVLTWRQQLNFGQSASQKKEQKDEQSVHEECQNPYCRLL